jgi:hypothetical protein
MENLIVCSLRFFLFLLCQRFDIQYPYSMCQLASCTAVADSGVTGVGQMEKQLQYGLSHLNTSCAIGLNSPGCFHSARTASNDKEEFMS